MSVALECTSAAVFLVDDGFRCAYANPAATELVGHPPDVLVGAQLHELLGCGLGADDTSCVLQTALARRVDVHSARGVMRHRDGRWLAVTATLVDCSPAGAVLVVYGVLQQVPSELDLAERAAHYRQMVTVAPHAFFGVRADGTVTSWSAAAAELLGHSAAHAVGRDAVDLLIPERYRDVARMSVGALLDPDRDGSPIVQGFHMLALHRDGHEFLVEMTVTSVRIDGSAGVEVSVRDLSMQQRLGRQVQQMVMSDPLTGLPNRTLLMDRLDAATRRLGGTTQMLAVLFVDIDHFKVVNDSLGHGRGDELLVAVADRLRATTRDSDTVARFGGDEFVILMDQVQDEFEVVRLARRIAGVLAAPVLVGGREITSSASIGIATSTDPSTTPEELLRDADAAMYRAKERGRNRFELFDVGMRQRAVDRLETEGELRRALDEGQLRVHYQPIVSVEDERVVGFEALARWQHPTRGLLAPADFIHLAEECGLIGRVGEIILNEALRQCGEWLGELRRQRSGRTLSMFINLSASQVMDDRLPDIVAAALAKHGVPAAALGLEITESVLMDDFARARVVLQQLRKLGVSIALDNFGTGYSSMLYLRDFPVDILKLDRFFVAGLAHSRADQAIAASVISLAHALDMRAVGEGVETAEQRAALRGLRCDLAQGFLWYHPLSAPHAAGCLGLLPRAPAEAAAPAAVSACAPAASVSSDVTPIRVVLVDDNTAERRLLALTLEDLPEFTVIGQAADGAQGVAVIAGTQPDVVLLDLSMPGVDGLQALPGILEAAPHIRVVILSGFISEGVSKIALSGGAVGCLDKNVGLDRLPVELLKLLGRTLPSPSHGVVRPERRRRRGAPRITATTASRP